jgi:hypothetical protein
MKAFDLGARWRSLFVAGTLSAVLSVPACGTKEQFVPPTAPAGLPANASLTAAARSATAAHFVADVPAGSLGPFWATSPSGSRLAAYVGPAEGQTRSLVTLASEERGEFARPGQIALRVPMDVTGFALRALPVASTPFAAAWTHLADRAQVLSAALLGVDGVPKAPPVELARSAGELVWFDVLGTERGALALWVEQTKQGDGTVFAAALAPDGKLRGVPVRVTRGVSSWHAIATSSGVLLAVALTSETGAQSLEIHRLDELARPSQAPVALSTGRVAGDLELVRAGRGYLCAWTEREAGEPTVRAAAVDDLGKIIFTKTIASQPGGATLLALVAGPSGVVYAWEERRKRTQARRRIYIGKLGDAGTRVGAAYTAEVDLRAAFELHAAGEGFAYLAGRQLCSEAQLERGVCDGPSAPMITRLSKDLEAQQSEVLKEGTDALAIGWGLSCDAQRCLSLAARGSAPAHVALVSMDLLAAPPKAADSAPKVAASAVVGGPQVDSAEALVTGESVAQLATLSLGDVTLVATLVTGSAGTAGQGGGAGKGAQDKGGDLVVRALDKRGQVVAKHLISPKALSVGGVALAPFEKVDDGAIMAWVARENGDPEVHITKLDKRGRRTNDIQLTTTKGDASDVALAPIAGGWLVAWVDGRQQPAEVFATKVSPDLQRVAREERITQAPGDKTDLVLLRGDDNNAWLAWSDSRESPADGSADVYVTQLRGHDAKKVRPELRLLPSAAHSRSPRLGAVPGGGAAVTWIEDAPFGAENVNESFGAMISVLDKNMQIATPASRLALAGPGTAQATELEGTGTGLRVVVARTTRAGIVLDALEQVAPYTSPLGQLLSLEGNASTDVPLSLSAGALFFAEDGQDPRERRLRRALLRWKP